MDGLTLAFILISVVTEASVGLIVLFGVRRFRLRGALGTVDASTCWSSGRWQSGICRFQETQVEWFALFSLSLRPKYVFRRSALELTHRRRPTEQERLEVLADSVIVAACYENQRLLFAMCFDAYAGMSAWLEAGPAAPMQ